MAHIHSVKTTTPTTKIPARAASTSFRIPEYWLDRVRTEADRLNTSISQIYLAAITNYLGAFSAQSSWEVTGDEDAYDPARFYTKSQDRQGHSFSLRANIPKPLAGEINALVTSRIVPAYRSTGDFIRDAIYHRAKQLARMIDSGELEQAADMAMLLSEEIQINDEAEDAAKLIEAMRGNAQRMIARGSYDELKRYLFQRRENSTSIPESYRDDYMRVVKDFEARIAKQDKKTKIPKRRAKGH